MVARFVPSKRQDVIVRAMAQLPDTFHALFVGGTENDEGLIKVRDLSKSLGVENRIHFLYLRSDVPRILKSSDVIVMSSEYEGLSLSSIEGMACGHPFVASDVNGLREVVNGAGVLVKCGDVEGLASVLMELKNNAGYREEIICKCGERASQYDIKKVAGNYIQLYKELLAE